MSASISAGRRACEDLIGTGSHRARTEVIYADLGSWAISGSIHSKGDLASWRINSSVFRRDFFKAVGNSDRAPGVLGEGGGEVGEAGGARHVHEPQLRRPLYRVISRIRNSAHPYDHYRALGKVLL